MLKNGGHHRWQTISDDFLILLIGKTRLNCNIIDSIFFLMAKPKRSQRMKRLCQIVTCLAIIGHAQPTHHNTMQNKAPHPFTGQWITIGSLANLKPLDVFHRQLAPAKFKPEDQKARNQHVPPTTTTNCTSMANSSTKAPRPAIRSTISTMKSMCRIIW